MSNLSVAAFRAWKGNPTAPDNATIQAAIDAAEFVIGEDVGRYFAVAGSSSARTYAPQFDGQTILPIHDCTSIVSVSNDGTTVTAGSNGYQAEPVNVSWAGNARPYTQLRLLSGSWVHDKGRATVTVTATWGWSALPSAYTEATKILAADVLDQRALQNGVVAFTEYAAIRVRANPMVAQLLAPLRRAESWGIG